MGQNWNIDPVAKDYVLENGAPVPTDDVRVMAYFILTLPMGNWLYADNPTQGSELWRFNRAKRTANTEKLFASRVTSALNSQLVARGNATQVAVKNIATSRDGTSNEIDVTPKAQQLSGKLNFNPL